MTGQVATIVPIAHLDLIKSDSYFMALSYMCEDDRYARFFYDRATEGKYVILDNSAVEMGAPEDSQTYIEKALAIGASEILLPDWFKDSARTLEAARVTLTMAKSLDYRGRFQAVPQGHSATEWFENLQALLEIPEVTTIGLSRRYNVAWMFVGGRYGPSIHIRMSLAKANRQDVKIHWLGQLHHPIEERVWQALRYPHVQGIDSSLPTIATRCGELLTNDWSRPEDARPPDFLTDEYDRDLMSANVQRWRAMCGA